jgi:alpha-L-arabinofuranosidase
MSMDEESHHSVRLVPPVVTLKTLVATSLLACLLIRPAGGQDPAVRLSVNLEQPGITVSPLLYGIFFEEINRAGDGGIYAEMLGNRSFEDDREIERHWRTLPQKPPLFPAVLWERPGEARPVYGWSVHEGRAGLDESKPLNPQNRTSLRLDLAGRAKVSNSGFIPFRTAPGTPGVGLHVTAGSNYLLSLYARTEGLAGPLGVSLESQDGSVRLAERKIEGIGREWKKFELELRARGTNPQARLTLEAEGRGALWLDMVSLFPVETWKGRRNGLRKDLMEMVEAMKPRFVRFPGGCFVEGDVLRNAVRWKKTIGDVAERPGTWAYRGYLSTDGLGMHEYLLMCEDLGAEPLLVVNCMMSHWEQKAPLDPAIKFDPADLTGLEEYVQDALDAIEYCNGPADSPWGAVRARAGHPAPFNLKWIEIGNENSRKAYELRYAAFHRAIKARYPAMNIISNGWKGSKDVPVEYVDDHYYLPPEGFLQRATQFDKISRNSPKIYLGEYAANNPGVGRGNLNAALGEAAYMIGMERNSDLVIMSSYAPLLTHYHWRNWNPDAIVFDQARAFGTPSYHLQTLFAGHVPEVILPLNLELPVELTGSGTGKEAKPARFFAGAGLKRESGEVILKVVNASGRPVKAAINLQGDRSLAPTAKAWVLAHADPMAENSFEEPRKIAPREEALAGIGREFARGFPAHSSTVIIIQTK